VGRGAVEPWAAGGQRGHHDGGFSVGMGASIVEEGFTRWWSAAEGWHEKDDGDEREKIVCSKSMSLQFSHKF
jgi:hypothetical protein